MNLKLSNQSKRVATRPYLHHHNCSHHQTSRGSCANTLNPPSTIFAMPKSKYTCRKKANDRRYVVNRCAPPWTARMTTETPNFPLKIHPPTKANIQNHRLHLKSYSDPSIYLEKETLFENPRLKDIRVPIRVSDGRSWVQGQKYSVW